MILTSLLQECIKLVLIQQQRGTVKVTGNKSENVKAEVSTPALTWKCSLLKHNIPYIKQHKIFSYCTCTVLY